MDPRRSGPGWLGDSDVAYTSKRPLVVNIGKRVRGSIGRSVMGACSGSRVDGESKWREGVGCEIDCLSVRKEV
jgi:hypothetical protein